MSTKLVLYILFCIAIGLGGAVTLFRMNRALSAAAFLILSILIFVFFGLRWFVYSVGDVAKWPPVINTCPDYLTSYTRSVGGQQVATCIDLVGVSTNASLKQFPATGVAPTDNSFYFPMCVNPSGKLTDNITKLCSYTRSAGLSWDGIINGQACVTANDPNAMSAAAKAEICGTASAP
jgi:hypothetical protein